MKEDHYLEPGFKERPSGPDVSRREFLKITGSGIFVFFMLGDPAVLAQKRGARMVSKSLPSDFNAFLRIHENGRVSCYTGKIEMGQGVITSLAQMLADELDVSLDAVDMVMGDTDLCPWDMGTFGSRTTRFFGPPLRAAGAEARRVLLKLASDYLETPVESLATENGMVFDKRNKKSLVAYGRLTLGKRIDRHLSEAAETKRPSDFKIMNRPAFRTDALEKVTGRAKYAGDIQIPGMLYAKILRPPSHGARLIDVDLSGAELVPGIRVIRDGDLIAVLHEYPDVAERALSEIRVKFQTPESDLNEKNIFAHLLSVAPQGEVVAEGGLLQKGELAAKTLFEETYLDGYVAHAPIETHTALVKIEGKRATVWASSQTPFRVKEEVAAELDLPEENVRVISPYVGGGFGGKTMNLQAVEAARLAKLSGKPVQVAWSREEEFFNDTFRPAAVVKIKSGITEQGIISLWDYRVYFAGERGSQHFYDIPNHRTMAHGSSWRAAPGSHPFATGAWRAPANNTNTFARESQMDIMAAKAGMDPFEFRMKHLGEGKMKRLLKAAAEKFGWRPASAPSGRGYGIACGTDAGTLVATMAEVRVDEETGHVTVKRVLSAQDMGLVINPEGARIQMEGCVTMGLGYALKEDIHFRGGDIQDLNFDTYEIPRFSWVPEIETVIIDDKDSAPQGGGEPAIITMGAVIANAVFDAVGVRVFQLPMTPERIKEADND
jgi:nicotinate dehydrogenase subunit B